MAMPVVHGFETIDINKKQAVVAAVTVAARTPAVELINEIVSVEQGRKRVAYNELFQFSHARFEHQILAFKS